MQPFSLCTKGYLICMLRGYKRGQGSRTAWLPKPRFQTLAQSQTPPDSFLSTQIPSLRLPGCSITALGHWSHPHSADIYYYVAPPPAFPLPLSRHAQTILKSSIYETNKRVFKEALPLDMTHLSVGGFRFLWFPASLGSN